MRLGRRDAEALDELIRGVARAEIMPRFRRLDPSAIREKTSALDLVTEADEAAERALTEGLLAMFPGCVVVGEEAAAADPAVLDRLVGAPLAVIVDPIDGTANYAAGLPLFGVMVAVVVAGEVAMAAIHDPVGNDTSFALRGEGAWTLRSDGFSVALRVAAPVPVARMSGGLAWRALPLADQAEIRANLDRVAASFTYRCAAHEYRLVAGGHCHYLLYGRLMPWDHAAGWLLHREAGGYAAHLDGTPYLPVASQKGLLYAPDGHRGMRCAMLCCPVVATFADIRGP